MTPEFLSQLDTRILSDERAVLLAPLVYRSAVMGRELEVPAGFVTDWASVPRLPFAYMVAGGKARGAAVVHDFLYTTKICNRATADAVFREAMAVTGQPWWRRQLMWAGVRLFGWIPYDADDDEPKGEAR
jgi:hypothetical protein